MLSFFISLLAFIFAIAILVVFHELGHFWVARRLGVKVLRFSVGFGRVLWSHKGKDDVEYVISALPLGGYVKMLDEREEPVPDALKPYAFNRQPIWARFAIVFAGPLFNFIFAIFAYWLMFMIGVTGMIAKVGEVLPDSIAAHAGLEGNEVITAVDTVPTESWQQVFKQLMKRIGDKDSLVIQAKTAEGLDKTFELPLANWEAKGSKPNLLHALGIEPFHPPIPPIIEEVVSGDPADEAGLLPQDEVVEANGKPVNNWKDFTDVVTKHANQRIEVTVKRNDELKTVSLVPRLKETDNGKLVGFVGLIVKVPKLSPEYQIKERLGPWNALIEATKKTKDYTMITISMLGKLVTGKVGLQSISGPITIAQGAGATVVVGLPYYLGFLALISISLGVINLLPIPILDGGHLFYFLIEAVTRRPLSEKAQLFGFKIGMIFLIFLMVIAFYNDLIRLF